MSDFLLELRCEEIPARMQAPARDELGRRFHECLAAAGVVAERAAGVDVAIWSTPRRLALLARGLPTQTAALHEEIKGPRISAPEQALAGFLRKTGLLREQLTERDGVWFALAETPGQMIADVLARAIPVIIRTFAWPRSMRWGAASLSSDSLRWVRPLQGIVALLDDDVVDCTVDGIRSGRVSQGHRFHAPEPVTIATPAAYVDTLRQAFVLVDQHQREVIIQSQATEAARQAGLTLVADAGLVVENAGLTEWPVPLLGRFDAAFLDVPPEVIQLTARINQKYFICRDAAGTLANAFICTANIAARDGGAGIVAGNRKVLAARLADARFFWEQDRKHTLADHARGLQRITFHEQLGTVADKASHVADLARWLATEVVPGADPALAEQAARLCKADLVTEMVGEFPELQGLMGGYYARAEGLSDAVADAIRDHYKPVGQGDGVPCAPVTVCVALADKLDTLVRFFRHDLRPTGSKDPFALRRAALGCIRLILDNGLRLPLRQVAGDTADALIGFFADRLTVQQKEAGVRHDLIDAVFALGGEDDLLRLLARVQALQAFVGGEDGANLLAGYKRAANILKAEARRGWPAGVANPTPEPAEMALIAALDDAGPRSVAAVDAEDFTGAMAAMASLRVPIDAFFEHVIVNSADDAVRASRLALLDRFRMAVHKVADFSRIEG